MPWVGVLQPVAGPRHTPLRSSLRTFAAPGKLSICNPIPSNSTLDEATNTRYTTLTMSSNTDHLPDQQPIVVIADDLTGATDTGLQFSKFGLRTGVYFDLPLTPGTCDVIAITTESRSRPADDARRLVAHAGSRIGAWNTARVYKKIDSTMRGNVGAEVEALAGALDRRLVVLAPAFPASGRTVRNGRLFVNGVPLAESEFGTDPLSPQRHSRIGAILAEQSDWRIVEVGLNHVRHGAAWLSERIEQISGAHEPAVVVCDAVTPNDLRQIARASAGFDCVLPAGSAGLAEMLPEALGMRRNQAGELPPLTPADAVLAVVGSVNPISRRQLELLSRSQGVATVEISAEELIDPDARRRETDRGARETKAALTSRMEVALTFNFAHGTDELAWLAEKHGLTIGDLTETIVRSLGTIVVRTRPVMDRLGLVITGGDTAIAVCRALGGTGMVINREVAPGIPTCALVGGDYQDTPVVTKAGGFGSEDALLEALRTLKGRSIS